MWFDQVFTCVLVLVSYASAGNLGDGSGYDYPVPVTWFSTPAPVAFPELGYLPPAQPFSGKY